MKICTLNLKVTIVFTFLVQDMAAVQSKLSRERAKQKEEQEKQERLARIKGRVCGHDKGLARLM